MSNENETDLNNLEPDLDLNAVAEQLKTMKPETFEQVASLVNAKAEKLRASTTDLSTLTNNEYYAFRRKTYGY